MSDPVQAYAALHEQWKQENKGTFEWWLFTKIVELEQWKKEAMQVMPDYQEIGKLLNLPAGMAVHKELIPKLRELVRGRRELDASRKYHCRNCGCRLYDYEPGSIGGGLAGKHSVDYLGNTRCKGLVVGKQDDGSNIYGDHCE